MRAVVLFVLLAAGSSSFVVPAAAQDEQPPVLHRGNSNPSDSDSSTSHGRGSTDALPPVSALGTIRAIDAKNIVVEAEDSRILVCKLTSSTTATGPDGKMNVSDLEVGMRVRIRAKADSEGENLIALSVTVDNPTAKPDASHTVTVQNETDEEGRPVLKRGIPAKRKSSDDDADDNTVASAGGAGELSRDAPRLGEVDKPAEPKPAAKQTLVDKAREANEEFSEKLPNFVCQQFTTRYQRESKQIGWQAEDIVSATVVYVDGKEDYQNIKVGNKEVKQDMMEIKGQRSVGEFGSVLQSLFLPQTEAEFHFVKDQDVKRLSTKVYDFTVPKQRSDWSIMVAGQTIIPAYSGRVWIEKESARVLRIERQADDVPEAFPTDTVEQTIDYDYVSLGGKNVLLPSESENLSCQRGTPYCSKNVIEFRNYREFRGEASITFDK